MNKDNRIVATGHNDLPNILADKVPPWEDTSSTVNDVNNKDYYCEYSIDLCRNVPFKKCHLITVPLNRMI